MKTLTRIPSHKALRLLVLSIVSLHQASGETSSWTGWLGPDQAARGQGFETPDTWPEELKQHWRVEVGEGYSTPLVVGDRIFQHARQGDDEVKCRVSNRDFKIDARL